MSQTHNEALKSARGKIVARGKGETVGLTKLEFQVYTQWSGGPGVRHDPGSALRHAITTRADPGDLIELRDQEGHKFLVRIVSDQVESSAGQIPEPCPFCASTDLMVSSSGFESIYMNCRKCGADGPVGESMSKAVEIWNKRAG